VFLATISGIILYYMYVYTWNEKRRIFFVKPMENVPTVFRKRSIGNGKIVRSVNIGDNTFKFDIGKPTYRNRNKAFYFVDVDKGQIWISPKDTPEMSAKLLQADLKDEIGKQLVAGIDANPFMGNILMLAIGVIIGLLAGYILGQFVPMR
jgi:hypothetical protein